MNAAGRAVGILVLIGVSAFGKPAQANLIQNGDFAGGSGADWSLAVDEVYFTPGAQLHTAPCPDPSFCASPILQVVPFDGGYGWFEPFDLGFGVLSQSFATAPGQSYRVTYTLGGIGASPGFFVAGFDGSAFLPSTTLFSPSGSGVDRIPVPPGFLDNAPTACSTPSFSGEFPSGCSLWEISPNGITITTESFTTTATTGLSTLEFAGSAQGASWFVTHVSVVAVAEPSSLSLTCLGALAAGFLYLRTSKRRTRRQA